MQLIGRNLSPFVRRTTIVLQQLRLTYEQVGYPPPTTQRK